MDSNADEHNKYCQKGEALEEEASAHTFFRENWRTIVQG